MLTNFKSLFQSASSSSGRRQPANLLGLDRLDDRLVPTVVFRPHFGAETIAPGSTNDALTSPAVQLIFAGSYWNTAIGSQDRATIISQTQNLVGGTYLSALSQYGGDGKATLGTNYTDATGIAGGFSTTGLQTYLQGQITSNPVTPFPVKAVTAANTNIYVVITPPGESSGISAAGYNIPLNYTMPAFLGGRNQIINAVWCGTSATATGAVNMSEWGSVMSHELAEVISDPNQTGIGIIPPTGLPANLVASGRNQIGDNEPAAPRYSYNLNGVVVSPYWSARVGAYVVPDGNRQNFYVDPVWTGTGTAARFTGQYDLTVQGDQLGANYNDSITAGGVSNASTQTIMNGETVTFKSGQIRNLNVDTGGGWNTTNVNFAEAGETVNVRSSGGLAAGNYALSHDTVNLGGGYMSDIAGTVNVSNSSGTSSTFADDSKDTTGRTVHYTDHSINFSGSGAVNYDAGYTTNDGSRRGVTAASFWLGSGRDTVYVDSVNPLVNSFSLAQASDVYIGAAVGRLSRFNIG